MLTPTSSLLLGSILIAATSAEMFSEKNIKIIVDYHNSLRSNISKGTQKVYGGRTKGPAMNMRKMHWSKHIARNALNYANQCIEGKHSPSEKLPGRGENLYWIFELNVEQTKYAYEPSFLWADEFKNHDMPTEFLIDSSKIGHATQMAWHNTYLVGCGLGRCEKFVNVVCQYYPTGNYPNAAMYKAGKECSDCPAGTSCEPHSGLCDDSSLPMILDDDPAEEFNPTTTHILSALLPIFGFLIIPTVFVIIPIFARAG